jgi:hypothetical protein
MDKIITSFNYDLLKISMKNSILIMSFFLIFSCNKCEIKDGVYSSKNTDLHLKRIGSKYEIKIYRIDDDPQTKFMILNCEDKDIQSGYEPNTVVFNEEKLFLLGLEELKKRAEQRDADSLAALEATMVQY